MGVVKDLTIEVNENSYCYKLDEQGRLKVSGNVTFALQEATDVKYLKIVCKGKSLLGWVRGIRNGVSLHLDLLFKEKMVLISSQETGSKKLSAESHTFPFSFTISSKRHLPTTYIGNHGSISYKLYARIEIVGNVFSKKNWETKLPLTLYNPMTVNEPQFMIPIIFDKTLTEGGRIGQAGTISVSGKIDKGYLTLLSEDQLTVTLTISNMKRNPITPVVSLQEYVLYWSPNGSRKQSFRTLCQMTGSSVMPDIEEHQSQFKLGPVHDLIPGTIESPTNISVTYLVYIKLEGSMYFMNFPIRVGVGRHEASF